eukprot:gb/GECG01000600.1/.p1 GENE.gb/GECG01000600.1/~~gb/GECG01000600.1/.p1  ORF type:complete len:1074 (+),score=143.16 gb/GECG01000600.1/:1-3222(+)
MSTQSGSRNARGRGGGARKGASKPQNGHSREAEQARTRQNPDKTGNAASPPASATTSSSAGATTKTAQRNETPVGSGTTRPPSGKKESTPVEKQIPPNLEYIERPISKGEDAGDIPTPNAAAGALDTPKNEETVIRTRDGQPIVEVSDTKLDHYEVVKAIGKGKFSTVYRARRKSDGLPVALKKIQIFDMMDEKSREKCFREISLVNSLGHQNIIAYLESFIVNKELILAFEYAEAGDLKRQLRKAREREARFDERVIWRYFAQIADAVAHMHERRVMHRDLKPANIFLTRDGKVKVGDLGLGRFLSEHTLEAFSKVGTPLYMSPEVLQGKGYEWSSDVWSLGCLLYELAMLRSPFKEEGLNLYGLFQKITNGSYPPISSVYSSELRDLVDQMLQGDPSKRPDARYVAQKAHDMEKKLENNPSVQETSRETSQEGQSGHGGNYQVGQTASNEDLRKLDGEHNALPGDGHGPSLPTRETETDTSAPETSTAGSVAESKSASSNQSPTRSMSKRSMGAGTITSAARTQPTTTTENHAPPNNASPYEEREDRVAKPEKRSLISKDIESAGLPAQQGKTNQVVQEPVSRKSRGSKRKSLAQDNSEAKADEKPDNRARGDVPGDGETTGHKREQLDSVALSHSLFSNLSSLDYERHFCHRMEMEPLPHFFFATRCRDFDMDNGAQPGESNTHQLRIFVKLAAWLYSLASCPRPNAVSVSRHDENHLGELNGDYFGLGDDLAVHSPYTVAGAVLQQLNQLSQSFTERLPDLRPHKISKGYGPDCCFVLWWLSRVAIKSQNLTWHPPRVGGDLPSSDVYEVDGDDLEIMGEQDASSDSEEAWYADLVEAEPPEVSESKQGSDIFEPVVNPADWEKEVERVAPRLRQRRGEIATDRYRASDWRKHADNANTTLDRLYNPSVGLRLPDILKTLSSLSQEYEDVIRKVVNAEKFINRMYGNQDSGLLQELSELFRHARHHRDYIGKLQETVTQLSTEASHIEEQLQEVNEQLHNKGQGISDTQPVQQIRLALTKLRRENCDLQLRVGISMQRLDGIRVQQANKLGSGDETGSDEDSLPDDINT